MKKLTALLLTVCLCMAMAVPAFAAFPETWDEAKLNQYTSHDLYAAGFDTFVPLLTELYDGSYDEPVLSAQRSGFYAVLPETTFFYANTGTSDEYYLWVSAEVYHPDDQGRYVFTDMPGESLRVSGQFVTQAADDTIGDMTLLKLGKGESTSFTLESLGVAEGDIVCLYYYQYYPEDGRYWYNSVCYKIDSVEVLNIVQQIEAEKAAEAEQPAHPFTDVADDAYYYDAVLWAVENGITNGTSATTFGPDVTCTRSQVVTFLWRAKGCPEPTTTVNPFTDVAEADYFYKPVLWAVENGITNGTSATTFSPLDTCTSSQVVTFLWRANGQPAAEAAGTEWYAQAVAWANGKQLLDGTAVPFAPDNLAPRADIVTYLYRDLAK
ncbi:MAG: S-layer homology domain-containing protein [Clostridia bacterium]|nr:S-layer homology domain-containing protein [Clostridia bacterium]